MFGRKKLLAEPAWCIAEVRNEEERIVGIARFIDHQPADFRHLKTAVGISWKYAEDGLPATEMNREMNEFERAIDPLRKDHGNSQMAYVRTAFGVKEWLFYARDSDAFMHAFNERLAGHPRYPLEISFYADAKWKLWREFVQPLSEKAKWEEPSTN
jgi:hypothetical protein